MKVSINFKIYKVKSKDWTELEHLPSLRNANIIDHAIGECPLFDYEIRAVTGLSGDISFELNYLYLKGFISKMISYNEFKQKYSLLYARNWGFKRLNEVEIVKGKEGWFDENKH